MTPEIKKIHKKLKLKPTSELFDQGVGCATQGSVKPMVDIKVEVLQREKSPGFAPKHERSSFFFLFFARGSKKRGIKVTGGVTFYTSFEVQPATAIMLKRKCTQCTRGIKFTSVLHNVPYASRGAALHPPAVRR